MVACRLCPYMYEPILAGALLALLATVTVWDLRARVIPDWALLPAAAVAIATVVVAQPETLAERLASATGAGGFLLAAALIRPEGMGLGDVKLAAVLGLFLGRPVATALVVALLAGALCGFALTAARGVPVREETIPFAPFLAIGAAATLIAADTVEWWN
jgi:leader peptidase (prepilin peptidase) / N-methyltransferase